jgi:hypothetical protein
MRRFVLLMLLSAPVARATGQGILTTGLPLGHVFFGWGAEINLALFLGQTFVVPEGLTTLTGFEFEAGPGPSGSNPPGASNFRYTAGIQAWDPVANTAIGPVLFSTVSTRLDLASFTLLPPSFQTGGITVTPGQAYIAFLSATGFAPPSDICHATQPVGSCDDLSLLSITGGGVDTYADGHIVVGPSSLARTVLPNLIGYPIPDPNKVDVALTVSFAPEPASWMLTATGLIAIAALVRRRRSGVQSLAGTRVTTDVSSETA